MNAVFRLWDAKSFATLIPYLERTSGRGVLEDLRLFLLADCLRQAGRDAEALAVYERLVKEFPDFETARSARLPYFLRLVKAERRPDVASLLDQARGMPTAWQRGRALQEVCEIFPPGGEQRSMVALEAVRAFHQESPFYSSVGEAGDLLKRILADPTGWRFSAAEWIEILRFANRDGLQTPVIQSLSRLRGVLGQGPIQVLEAEALRAGPHKERAVTLLEQVITGSREQPAIQALAWQVRGDLMHFSGRHSWAVSDLRKAVEWGKPPVDVVAARYRLMRSAFEGNLDAEAIKEAKALCRSAREIPLLPNHLYEMGLTRYDAGAKAAAVSYFLLLAKEFPGHYRADDALGYAAVCLQPASSDGKPLIQLLKAKYPHSFFLYWLDPGSRAAKLPMTRRAVSPSGAVAGRKAAWQLLLAGPFARFARDEIRVWAEARPLDWGLFKTAMEAASEAGDFNQVTAFGERLLKNLLDAGKPAGDLPDWAWKGHYPRPFWSRVAAEARRYRLDPHWILGIMREESHFNPRTLSRSNAMGLMQILPSTGKWIAGKLGSGGFAKDSLWDIDRNIAFGTWYLDYLRTLFNGDLFLAAASYNGGQGNIQRKVEAGPFAALPVLERLDRVPLPETRDYYKKVMGSWWNYGRIYPEGR